MQKIEDTLVSQIPGHVVESYPFFVQFLKGYYEWMGRDDNPYGRIKNHLDYLSFKKTMPEYVSFMQEEFLNKLPQNAIGDKKIFIEWSKKLNLAKGSHESYKFLFRMLFGETTTEIYLPKQNILRTSDGEWISNQVSIITTNSGNPEKFLYKRISQRREIFPGVFETAEATVDSFIVKYSSKFNVVEFTLTDVVGNFVLGYPISDTEGNSEYPIPSVSSFDIINGGQNFSVGDRIEFDPNSWTPNYVNTLVVSELGILDTQISTTLSSNDIQVKLNNVSTQNFEYDGRFLYSNDFEVGDSVNITLQNAYEGLFYVSVINSSGAIVEISVSDSPICLTNDIQIDLSFDSAFGQNAIIKANTGLVRNIPGYYVDEKGHLSSQMYLQDSDYYQDYSYEIRTEQDFQKYADVVLNVLHPAGFKVFGRVRLINIIEILIGVSQDDSDVIIERVKTILSLSLYSLGSNYLFFAKSGGFMSPRMYKGNEWNNQFIVGDSYYALEDKSNERAYDSNGELIVVLKRGWMTKNNLSDADILQPEDYFEMNLYDYLYMESSYVNTENMDINSFINTYVDLYAPEYYWDDYTE